MDRARQPAAKQIVQSVQNRLISRRLEMSGSCDRISCDAPNTCKRDNAAHVSLILLEDHKSPCRMHAFLALGQLSVTLTTPSQPLLPNSAPGDMAIQETPPKSEGFEGTYRYPGLQADTTGASWRAFWVVKPVQGLRPKLHKVKSTMTDRPESLRFAWPGK